MKESSICVLWEPKEPPDPYDYHPQKKNCGMCSHYMYNVDKCTREPELHKKKRPS